MKLESASLILDAMIATLLGRIDSLSGENASMFHCESVVWSRIIYIARLYCRDDKYQFLTLIRRERRILVLGIWIWKWPNPQKNSKKNDEIPTKIQTICDTLPIYTSSSSFSFLLLLLPLPHSRREEEEVNMGAENLNIPQKMAKFLNGFFQDP